MKSRFAFRLTVLIAALALILSAFTPVVVQAQAKPTTFYGGWPYSVPPKGHLNAFVPDGLPGSAGTGIYTDLIELPFGIYVWATGKYEGMLAESWGFQGDNKYVVKLRKEATWSDGSPVTAKDVIATFNLGRLRNFTAFTYVDTTKAVDDQTVEFALKQPSTVVERLIVRQNIRAAAVYGAISDKVQKFLDANKDKDNKDKDEWAALVKELNDFRPTKLLASGPYTIADLKDVTDSQMTLRKNEKSAYAKNVKFDQVVLYNGETDAVTPLFLNKEMYYGTYAFPLPTEKALTDAGFRILRSPTYSGPAVFFNFAVPPFDKLEVRQAFAYIIDRGQAGAAALGESGVPVKLITGFSDNLAKQWLPDDAAKQLDPYAKDAAKADALLTKVGFKKDGANWTLDGKPAEFELSVPSDFTDWVPAAQNVARQLTSAGLKINVRGIPNAQHLEDVKTGKFQLAIRLWGIGNPHPFFAYRNMFIQNAVGKLPADKGISFPLKQKVDGKDVDLEKLLTDSGAGVNLDAQKKAVGEMAVAFNKLLPLLPIFERYGNTPLLESALTGVPSASDAIYQNAFGTDSYIVLWLFKGTIGPK